MRFNLEEKDFQSGFNRAMASSQSASDMKIQPKLSTGQLKGSFSVRF